MNSELRCVLCVAPLPKEKRTGPPPPQPAEASMSYVAYFKGDKEDPHRPITFLFNGGPGSSTVWLQMHFYTSGQMVYAHEPDLQTLHANVAVFIEKTKNGGVSR